MLPSFIRHGVFTNIVYFILCYIVRYRRKVMMGNLERSFPDKSHEELNTLCKRAYYNLAEQIINTIRTQKKDGAIVLMHENYTSTATAMETLIPELVAEGWQIVSVSELFKAKGLELKDGQVYSNAR